MFDVMDSKTRFLSVFSDEGRKKLDRVPTFVQGVLEGFIQENEEKLFDYSGKLTYNVRFDAAVCLGFDAVFAGLPSSVTAKPTNIILEDGKEVVVGMGGQLSKSGTTYYSGGAVKNLDILNKMKENLRIIDASESIKKTIEFYKQVSPIIFPVPMIGGIFDTVWQAMGFTTFSKNYRKNTKLYREIIKHYATITKINIEKIIEATSNQGRIINILDDVAFKGHLMISPERWNQDIGPYYKEIVKIIHDAGMHAIIHTDGDITELVPSLINVGFEGLQGWEGGANPEYIADKFPEFVVIGFGDVGDVLPFGTLKQIEAHVKGLMDALKQNRHYIFGPSTVVFKEMPLENVKYFVELGKKLGEY